MVSPHCHTATRRPLSEGETGLRWLLIAELALFFLVEMLLRPRFGVQAAHTVDEREGPVRALLRGRL